VGKQCCAIALALSVFVAPVHETASTLAQAPRQPDPLIYLLPAGDLPAGFEHQPEKDRRLDDPGVVRALRFYTRGAPEVPTADHASILLAVSVGESTERAVHDFQETVRTWMEMGYELSDIGTEVGLEGVFGWDTLYAGTDHPKRAAVLIFRQRMVSATVQWTDDPSEVTFDHALAIARLIELRILS
jgi:hypothetical protein